MNNVVILRTPFKITKAYLTPCRIPGKNQYPSFIKPIDDKDNIILSDKERDSGEYFMKETEVIEIYDGKTFDLDDPIESRQWEAIKYHKIIAKSRDERDEQGNLIIDGNSKRYGVADWYVETPGLEASNRNNVRRKKIEAQKYIIGDTPEERKLKAKVLGKAMDNAHDSDVEDYLMQEAERTPSRIIDLYTGGDMSLRLLFIKAKDKKIIINKDRLWFYNDAILGSTDESDIMWMKQPANKKLVKILEQEVDPELFTQKK